MDGKETDVSDVDLMMSDNGSTPPGRNIRLPMAILLQVGTIVIAAVVAVMSVQAKVDRVATDHDREVATNAEILKRVAELDAKVDYLTREIWYIRAKTDRMVEKKEGN